MAYVEAHASLRDHLKTKKVARLLGIPKVQVIGHLLCLWWWCQEYAQDGNLGNYDDADISEAAEWPGDAGAFVNALLTCGPKGGVGFLCRVDDGNCVINDWYEYGGKLFVKREQEKQRQRNKRARHADVTRDDRVTTGDVTDIDQIRSEEIRSDTDLSTTSDDVVADPAPPPAAGLEEKKTKPKAKSPAAVEATSSKPKATARGAASPYKDHPAVLAYRDTHNRWPQAGQMKLIAESDPPIGDWVRALTTWTARGYNPNNIEGVLEWAHNPARMERQSSPPPARSKQNGANPHNSQPGNTTDDDNDMEAEYIAKLKQRYG